MAFVRTGCKPLSACVPTMCKSAALGACLGDSECVALGQASTITLARRTPKAGAPTGYLEKACWMRISGCLSTLHGELDFETLYLLLVLAQATPDNAGDPTAATSAAPVASSDREDQLGLLFELRFRDRGTGSERQVGLSIVWRKLSMIRRDAPPIFASILQRW